MIQDASRLNNKHVQFDFELLKKLAILKDRSVYVMDYSLKNETSTPISDNFKILKTIVLTGGLILNIFKGKVSNLPKISDLPINKTEDTSTAHTIIDDLIQEIALEILSINYSDVSIIVEEVTSRVNWFLNNVSDFYFHLDPLDGTLAYIKNRNDFSVGAAFSQKQEFVASAIYFPAFDRLYYTEKNLGYIHVQTSLGEKISFHRSTKPLKLYCQKRCEVLIPIVNQMNLKSLDCLSAHHKMIAIAEGNLSVQMCHLANPHDFGIPQIIVEEAGGICTNLEGKLIKFNSNFERLPYFLAFYNENIKNDFFKLLNDSTKQN